MSSSSYPPVCASERLNNRAADVSASVAKTGAAGKKITIFLPSFRGGGAERAMLLLAEGLIVEGYSVDIAVAEASGPLLSMLPKGARLIDFKKKRMFRVLPSLVRYLRSVQPLALYATVNHSNIIAILAARLAGAGTPVIVRESNVPKTAAAKTLSGQAVLLLLPRVYRWAHAVIAVSDDVRDELLGLNPRLGELMHVLPTPVISSSFDRLAAEAVDHSFYERGSPPVVIGVGRLHPQKDFSLLIRAFARVTASTPLRLVILGEGSERKSLETLARELGVGSSVSFPGFVANPLPYIRRAGLFVLSSRYEGMPNVLIQAMALGTPVVAADCPGGPREVTCGGRFGTLVPVGDVAALARSMTESLARPPHPEASGYVRQRFGIQASVRSYLSVLESAP